MLDQFNSLHRSVMLSPKPPFEDCDTTLYKVLKVSWAYVREEATIKLNPDPKIVLAVCICLSDRHDSLQVLKARGAAPDLAANEEVCFGEGAVVCALDHDSIVGTESGQGNGYQSFPSFWL